MNEIFNRAKRFVDDLTKELPTQVDKAIAEVDTLRWSSEYSQTETYARGSIVRYRNQLWVALQEVRNEDPASSKLWDFAMEVPSFGGAVSFIQNAFIISNDTRVVIIFSNTPSGTFNSGVTFTVNGGPPQTFLAAIGSSEYPPNGVEYFAGSSFSEGDVVRWIYDGEVGNLQVGGEDLPNQDYLVNNLLDQTAPQVTSALVSGAGTTLTILFDETVSGSNGFTLTVNGEPSGISLSQQGNSQIVYDITGGLIYQGNVVTLDYAAGDIEDTAGNALVNFSDFAVTNNSIQIPTTEPRYVLDYGTLVTNDLSAYITSVGGSPTQPATPTDQNDPTHFLSGSGACHVTVDDPSGDSVCLLRFNDPSIDWGTVKTLDVWVYDATLTDNGTAGASDLQIQPRLYESAFQGVTTGYQETDTPGSKPCNVFSSGFWQLYSYDLNDFVDIGSPSGDKSNIVWWALSITARGTTNVSNCWIDSIYLNTSTRAKILWTFDDASDSDFDFAYAYMQPLGLFGTSFCPQDTLAAAVQLTVANAQAMYAAGWDIANHSDDAAELDGLPTATAISKLNSCRDFLVTNSMPRASKLLAFPGNDTTPDLNDACDTEGYEFARGAAIGSTNYMPVQGHPDAPSQWPLERFGGQNVLTISQAAYDVDAGATLKAAIQEAVDFGRSIFLMAHRIVASGATGNEINDASFKDLVDFTKSLQDADTADIVTISDWYTGL